MDISLWMNYKTLKEGYTIHYDPEDANLLSDGKLPVADGSKYKADLFRTFCDIMSVDYEKLVQSMVALQDLFDEPEEAVYGEDEVVHKLRMISPVLLDADIIFHITNKLFEDHFSNFSPQQDVTHALEGIIAFQCFIWFYIDNEEMQNLNAYTTFINNAMHTDIPKNIIMKKAIKAGDYREFRKEAYHSYLDQQLDRFLLDWEKRDQNTMHYLAESPLDFLIASMYEIVRNGYLIKRCQLCGKLFVPYNRSDTIYCDRLSPQDKKLTCKKYGSQKLWYDELKKDETKRLARNIYQSKQMLVRRNPDILEYQTSFEGFKEQLKQWKADVKAGVKTDAEYLDWLNYVKGKKVL